MRYGGYLANIKGASGIGNGKVVTQTAHSFTFGTCIKRDGEGNWIKSKADTRANAGTVGIVSEVIDADHFRYITGGLLPGTFTDGADYFLSTTTAGEIFIQSDPEVWEIGNVREFIGTGTANGLEVEIDLGDEIVEEEYMNSCESLMIACSDELSDLQAGYAVVSFRMPYEMTLVYVRASVVTPPNGSEIQVDINKNLESILSTKLIIENGELSSKGSAVQPVISDKILDDDSLITIDIDNVGSLIAGAGLKIYLIGYRK